ncbi:MULTISPECIES: hypothetical protein [unclassified Moorena]|uniref:hypothetical protein n=1 Tax=unclassified Moorena TaxID=2683338 RepID=UPI001400E036|nr:MULTISPECIES: hypothetical protein [unclassified Moorena]NEO15323.1 hypothetical protein [Moorena sp. SIO3E8]NEQ01724.1 hypothetical protein [Moorena sp. SIO3F7]
MLNLQSKNLESLLYKKNSAIQLTKNFEYGLFPLLPTPYSLLPTPYSLLPTPYSLQPTAKSLY